MNETQVLSQLKSSIESLKREGAIKEGEINSVVERIKKDFSVKNIDDAYVKLEALGKDIKIKKERREDLIKEASDKLAEYKRS